MTGLINYKKRFENDRLCVEDMEIHYSSLVQEYLKKQNDEYEESRTQKVDADGFATVTRRKGLKKIEDGQKLVDEQEKRLAVPGFYVFHQSEAKRKSTFLLI